MWRNYLTVGHRALTGSRAFAFINIFGLAIGLAALAGALALVMALGTIAGHAIKVARLNPIHALRYE